MQNVCLGNEDLIFLVFQPQLVLGNKQETQRGSDSMYENECVRERYWRIANETLAYLRDIEVVVE